MNWKPYQPSKQAPWDWRRVVHLHRRAGFGAAWEQVEREVESEPEAVVDGLLGSQGAQTPTVHSNFEKTSKIIAEAAVQSGEPLRLKAWWLYRCLFSPRPLQEKLTLLWHNHFATSNLKVSNLAYMYQQNEILRQHCLGNFSDLLTSGVKHPAMLVWLDATANRQGSLNENLARELLELFTLGVGNFTELDVKEAARALSGWTVRSDQFFNNPAAHDAGMKSILDKHKPFDGDALMELLVANPATHRRVAWRLCELFMGEGVADHDDIAALANGLGEHDFDIGWGVATILRSELFFSEANIASRVSSPLEYMLNAIRALELREPPPSTLLLAEWVKKLGQDLFYPPNVGGWQEGRAWLDSRAIVGRSNFAVALTSGDLHANSPVAALQTSSDRYEPIDNAVQLLCRLLCGDDLPPGTLDKLHTDDESDMDVAKRTSRLAARICSLPEAFLT